MVTKRSGRPPKTQATRQTQQTLVEAAVHAAKLIRDTVRGYSMVTGDDGKVRKVKVTRVAASKLAAAKIAIEHSLGLPKAKIELKTDALTMKDIAELAATFDVNSEESGDTLLVPTKPLTARQEKERANN